MNSATLKTLIGHGREDPSLEWKRKLNVREKYGQAELVRDMLSLVNAHGSGHRYLLIGVGDDGGVVGVDEELDDAILQEIVNNRIEPPIDFTTTYTIVDDATVGVIEIACSSKRFHIVSCDLNENEKRHLSKGQTWIKRGSSKTPPDAWDYERLREAVAEQSLPQPSIKAGFESRLVEVTVQPSWNPPKSRTGRGPYRYIPSPLDQQEEPPPGTAQLAFIMWNNGDQGAEDALIFLEVPEGCAVWDRPLGLAALASSGRRPVDIHVDEDDNQIVIRADSLVHGLNTGVLYADVTFPKEDRTHEFRWTGHAANMRKPTTGLLRAKVLCERGRG